MASRNTPLRLLPDLADYARLRAKQLGLPLSTYLGVLLWNFSLAPRKMKPEPAAAAFARVHVPCSMKQLVSDSAREAVRRSTLNRNSLIEALIAEDFRGNQAGLWIKSRISP